MLEAREANTDSLVLVGTALVRRFELLMTAQAGIPRLRDLILQLAVRGVLVRQFPTEGEARAIA